jgi:hypothetical protein
MKINKSRFYILITVHTFITEYIDLIAYSDKARNKFKRLRTPSVLDRESSRHYVGFSEEYVNKLFLLYTPYGGI